MYMDNTITSVRDYIRHLHKGGWHLKKFDVLDNQLQFERILDYLHQEAMRDQVKTDPIDTLEQFLRQNPS